MAERFSLDEAALAAALQERFGCIDVFSDADDLNRLLSELCAAEILRTPSGLEILIYPSAAAESDIALVTVFSSARPSAHVAAASEEIARMAPRELWEGDEAVARTVAIVDFVLGKASDAVATVRLLEQWGEEASEAPGAIASARCPKCGECDQLRVEYRYDLRGLSAGGALVLSEERELTEIFCLACGQEVDDVAPADGQLAGGAQGFSKRGGPGA